MNVKALELNENYGDDVDEVERADRSEIPKRNSCPPDCGSSLKASDNDESSIVGSLLLKPMTADNKKKLRLKKLSSPHKASVLNAAEKKGKEEGHSNETMDTFVSEDVPQTENKASRAVSLKGPHRKLRKTWVTNWAELKIAVAETFSKTSEKAVVQYDIRKAASERNLVDDMNSAVPRRPVNLLGKVGCPKLRKSWVSSWAEMKEAIETSTKEHASFEDAPRVREVSILQDSMSSINWDHTDITETEGFSTFYENPRATRSHAASSVRHRSLILPSEKPYLSRHAYAGFSKSMPCLNYDHEAHMASTVVSVETRRRKLHDSWMARAKGKAPGISHLHHKKLDNDETERTLDVTETEVSMGSIFESDDEDSIEDHFYVTRSPRSLRNMYKDLDCSGEKSGIPKLPVLNSTKIVTNFPQSSNPATPGLAGAVTIKQ